MSEFFTGEVTLGATVSKYQAVYITGDGTADPTTAATDKPYGIALDDGVSGDVITVCVHGRTKAIATDANVADGEAISAVASGEVDTNAGTATHYVLGTAMEDAPAANGYIEILVNINQVAQA